MYIPSITPNLRVDVYFHPQIELPLQLLTGKNTLIFEREVPTKAS
jgi:hypothetical protein